jgi:3-methyl-2-oxobutanoate hydroxymethyltransferase
VRCGAFPADEHSFHSKTLRLVPAPEPEQPESEEAAAKVYGAPV